MNVKGKITEILPMLEGVSEAGKAWKKISFILETEEEYNNLYCFEVFGEEKVDNFIKYNKVGYNVDVSFNVSTNKWKEKYFTSLQAWKIMKDGASSSTVPDATSIPADGAPPVGEDDLPF